MQLGIMQKYTKREGRREINGKKWRNVDKKVPFRAFYCTEDW